MQKKQPTQPVTPKILVRILVVIIIILAYLAGYYHSAWGTEQRKSAELEKQLMEYTQESLKE